MYPARSARADEAYITNQNGDDVSVLDLATKTVVASIKVGGKPAGIAMAHDGAHAYVSSTNGRYISAIDTRSRTVTGKVDLSDEVVGIAIGRDDRFLYAIGFFEGHLLQIDAATLSIVREIVIGARRPASRSPPTIQPC